MLPIEKRIEEGELTTREHGCGIAETNFLKTAIQNNNCFDILLQKQLQQQHQHYQLQQQYQQQEQHLLQQQLQKQQNQSHQSLNENACPSLNQLMSDAGVLSFLTALEQRRSVKNNNIESNVMSTQNQVENTNDSKLFEAVRVTANSPILTNATSGTITITAVKTTMAAAPVSLSLPLSGTYSTWSSTLLSNVGQDKVGNVVIATELNHNNCFSSNVASTVSSITCPISTTSLLAGAATGFNNGISIGGSNTMQPSLDVPYDLSINGQLKQM